MRIQLTEQESSALAILINGARSALAPMEGSESQASVRDGLRRGAETLTELQRRLPSMLVNVREARFLKNVISNLRATFESLEKGVDVGEMAKLRDGEKLLMELEHRFGTVRVDLSAEQRVALATIIDNTLPVLEELAKSTDGDGRGKVEATRQGLQDVRQRLESLELNEQEVKLLRGAVQSAVDALGSGSAEARDGVRILQGLAGQIKSPKVVLNDESRFALGVVLDGTLPVLKALASNPANAAQLDTLKAGQQVLMDLREQVNGVILTETESAVLQGVIQLIAQRASGAEEDKPYRELLEGLGRRLAASV
jgi:hypothetical protein